MLRQRHWCRHLTWHACRGEETGEMGTFCKLLFPACAKPLPLGWLMSCLHWLQANVKPFMGLPKGREFGRGEERNGRGWMAFSWGSCTSPGHLCLPGGLHVTWKITGLLLPFAFKFPSLVNSSLSVTSALWRVPKQTRQPAKAKRAVDPPACNALQVLRSAAVGNTF